MVEERAATTDGTSISGAELGFCTFAQKFAEKHHPSRFNDFTTAHVSDIWGCLLRSALSRHIRIDYQCETDFNFIDGILWEDVVLTYIKARFSLTDAELETARHWVFDQSIGPSTEHEPNHLPAIFPEAVPGFVLRARPDLFDTRNLLLVEAKRSHKPVQEADKICAMSRRRKQLLHAKANNGLRAAEMDSWSFEDALKGRIRLTLFPCHGFPEHYLQLISYYVAAGFDAKVKRPENIILAVIYQNAPRFYDVQTELSGPDAFQEKAKLVYRELRRRLNVYTRFVRDKAAAVVNLYAYEAVTRTIKEFCYSCPFLGFADEALCHGLPPLKLTHYQPKEVDIVKYWYEKLLLRGADDDLQRAFEMFCLFEGQGKELSDEDMVFYKKERRRLLDGVVLAHVQQYGEEYERRHLKEIEDAPLVVRRELG